MSSGPTPGFERRDYVLRYPSDRAVVHPRKGQFEATLRAILAGWTADWRFSVLLPAVLLAIATIVIRWTNVDLTVSRMTYGHESDSWPFFRLQPIEFLYHYGIAPAWMMVIGGILCCLVGWSRGIDTLRKAGLFCVLVMVIGPGLIINGLLKPNLHRPRPNQITEFGGANSFLPVLNMGKPVPDDYLRSFPCGHASTGFYLIAPAFVLYRRKPFWAAAFLLVGITLGTVLGVARIAQGRHFLSDVIWSAALVYFTALLLHYAMGIYRAEQSDTATIISFKTPGQPPQAPLKEAA